MKVIIPRTALASALALVKSAAGRKADMPILSNVRIEALEKSLKLTCTDLDITITTSVEADIKSTGDTTVPIGTLHELVRSFSDENVTLDQSLKKTINISCGKSRYDLGVLNPEEFPPKAVLKDAATFKLGQDLLRQLLASTDFPLATAPDNRPAFHGAYVSVNGEVTVATCDGRRLATATAAVKDGDKLTSIIPRRAVNELLRLLRDEEDAPQVTVSVAANGLRFTFGEVTLTSKAITEKYPEYQKLIPKLAEANGVTVARTDLLTALRRVGLIADKAVLEFEGQMLTVSGQSSSKEVAGKAEECLLIPKVNQRISAAYKTAFLIEALAAVPDDELTFFGSDNAPCVFRSKDGHWLSLTAAMKDDEKKDAKAEAKKPDTKEKK